MTTPIQRISRLLDEGARFMVKIPGHPAIDLTPDVIAIAGTGSINRKSLDASRNLLKANELRRDVPTRVQFP